MIGSIREQAENLFHQSDAARRRGDAAAAGVLLKTCIETDPGLSGPWYNLAIDRAEDRWAAVAALRRTLELAPGEPRALTNLGWHLQVLGLHEEARDALLQATESAPDMPLGWINLALTYSSLREGGLARAAAQRAIALAPNDPAAHMALAFDLMLGGWWAEGLKEYEWRFLYKMPEMTRYPLPKWDGGPVDRLFVPAEQGLGDTIQFSRFLTLAAERVGTVLAGVQEDLLPLMRSWEFPGNVLFVAMPTPIPEAEAYCPLLSLPVALGLSNAEVPRVPAPKRKPILDLRGRSVLPMSEGRLCVGIVWAGNPDHDNDAQRSASVADFLELYRAPGMQLYSLQVGDRAAEARPYAPLVANAMKRVRDFADTAEIVANMDVVVSVDTAVAHLAGSMGVQTELLIPRRGVHFAWGYDGSSTPWYPSVRLHRRSGGEGWASVMRRVAGDL